MKRALSHIKAAMDEEKKKIIRLEKIIVNNDTVGKGRQTDKIWTLKKINKGKNNSETIKKVRSYMRNRIRKIHG